MVKKRNYKKITGLLGIGFLVIGVMFSLSVKRLHIILSETKTVEEANVLLVEGWIEEAGLDEAIKEYQQGTYDLIVTTGLSSPEHCLVSMNGDLVFYTPKFSNYDGVIANNLIGVKAYSELDKEHSAHCIVLVNNIVIGDVYCSTKKKTYHFSWYGNLSNIDSITVRFDNDSRGAVGDRNLYVDGLIVNDSLEVPVQHNSVYFIKTPLDYQVLPNNATSYAEMARNYMVNHGIDSSGIIALSGEKRRLNRTLSSATLFKNWMQSQKHDVTAVNVLSQGVHARRTFISYKALLSKECEVGIIAVNNTQHFSWKKILKEVVGIAYYSVILLFY